MTKMAKESKHGCENIVLSSSPPAHICSRKMCLLKSAERRIKNVALGSVCSFWEIWRKSYDTMEMLMWHIGGRVTHPIPKRPVRLYQNKWPYCHILISSKPTASYEEGYWMVHVWRQEWFLFHTRRSASSYFLLLRLSEGIQSTVGWETF